MAIFLSHLSGEKDIFVYAINEDASSLLQMIYDLF